MTEATTETPATNGAAQVSSVSAALAQLAQHKGITLPAAESSGPEGTEASTTPAETTSETPVKKQGAESGAAPAPELAGDAKQLMDRYVAKDGQFQQERRERRALEKRFGELERQHNELIEALRNDPIGAGRKHGARFGDLAAAELLKAKGEQKGAPSDEMPAWAKELRDENKRLMEQLGTITKERDDYRLEQRQKARQQGIAGMLQGQQEFTMLNELGKHDVVLKLVEQHYGDDSDVPDERELQETILKYSREVERQLRADLDGLVKRPSIRDLVAKELAGGGKVPAPAQRKDAKPARQEIEGEDDGGDGAPVITNDLAQQRLSSAPPAAWNKDEALRKAAAEMQSIFQRGRASQD